MSLIPKLSVTISNSGNTIDVYEETGPFIINLDTTGWGTPNPSTADITQAFIEVYRNDDEEIPDNILETIYLKNNDIDVYAAVAGAPYPAKFLAKESRLWEYGEGVFKFIYKIYVDVTLFKSTPTFELFMPSLCNCREKITIQLLNARDSKELTEIKTLLDQVELFMYGAQASYSNADFVAVDTILNNASLVCATIVDCGCGCK
jgi:hypothetical protein